MSTTNDILAEVAEARAKIDAQTATFEPGSKVFTMPFGNKDDGGRALAKVELAMLLQPSWAMVLTSGMTNVVTSPDLSFMRGALVDLAAGITQVISEIDRRSGSGAEQSTNPDQPDVDKAFADLMGANYTPDEQEVLTKTEEVYSK